jgi:HlyD family secretion protein
MNGDVQIEIARRMDVVMVPNAAVVSTRDATAAGMVLGLDEAKIRAAMQASSEMAPMAQPGGESADSPQVAVATPGAAPTAGSPECEALMTKLRQSGFENASAADREKMNTCRGAAGANGRQGRAGQGGQGRGGRGGQARRGTPETRSGVVFVETATGPELRKVTLGLNDWDNTEVIRGLEPGEKVVLISVARLQQQQQEFVNRMRERAGGPIPGGGGGSGGRGR